MNKGKCASCSKTVYSTECVTVGPPNKEDHYHNSCFKCQQPGCTWKLTVGSYKYSGGKVISFTSPAPAPAPAPAPTLTLTLTLISYSCRLLSSNHFYRNLNLDILLILSFDSFFCAGVLSGP